MRLTFRSASRLSLLAAALLLTGCAAVTLVDPGKPADVGGGVIVMPQVPWNQIKLSSDNLLWTQNGVALDQLRFLTGIKTGQPTFILTNAKDASLFDAKMLPNDIQDSIVSNMGRAGFQNVRSANLAPCPFGAATGFCFDLSLANADGLKIRGKVRIRKQVDSLDMFAFLAPAEYYFDTEAPTVDGIFGSIRTK